MTIEDLEYQINALVASINGFQTLLDHLSGRLDNLESLTSGCENKRWELLDCGDCPSCRGE